MPKRSKAQLTQEKSAKEILHFEGRGHDSSCSHCGNNKGFSIHHSLINSFRSGGVAIFAGAGVSTEGRNILRNTFFERICAQLGLDPSNTSFSDAMQAMEDQPNGRIELVKQIRERIEYVSSFSELYDSATEFHSELATLFTVSTIITTNWDTYFEYECAAQPFVLDADIAFWDAARRRVLKIHGSIENPSTLIATRKDYKKSELSLRESLVGSMLKSILSTKTIVFCGYSLRDEDFREIMKFVQDSLGAFKRQNYVVTLETSPEALAKFTEMGLIPITTNAAFFLESVKEHLSEDDYFIPDKMYDAASGLLTDVIDSHFSLFDKFNMIDHPEIIYCASYQDGLIHLLKRVKRLRSAGIYSHFCDNQTKIVSYSGWRARLLREGKYEDVAYIDGYVNGLMFLNFQKTDPEMYPPHFYLFNRNPKEMDTLKEFEAALRKSRREKNFHKKAIQRATKLALNADPGKTRKLVFQHTCELG